MIATAAAIASAGIALAAGGASYATFVPGSTIWGPVIWHGPRDGPKQIALTFDDGPTPGQTDRLLGVLERMKVPAAFFVIGRNVEKAPELLRRVEALGHLVGNHTYDHSHFGAMRPTWFWKEQMARTDDAIAQVLGRRPTLFRPPIGHKTPYTLAAARELGHAVVTWSIRAMDGLPTTPQRILDRLLPGRRAGDILILHDGVEPDRNGDRSATIEALPRLIDGLRGQGFELVRLDQFLKPQSIPVPR